MAALSIPTLAHSGISGIGTILMVPVTLVIAASCIFTNRQTVRYLRTPASSRRFSLLIFPYVVAGLVASASLRGYWLEAFEGYKYDPILFWLHVFATASVLFSLLAPFLGWLSKANSVGDRAQGTP